MISLRFVPLATSLLLIIQLHAHIEHRVFPAASFERYSPENVALLRTLRADDFDVVYAATNKDIDSFLEASKDRFMKSFFLLPDNVELYPENPENKTLVPLKRLMLALTTNASSTDLYHGVDESYFLTLEDASVTDVLLKAKTVYGLLRGLETFSQLLKFQWMTNHNVGVFSLAPSFVIADAPEYPHRGLLIDTARHYLPLSLIIANLNVMAMNKLNVLHWHMTDSQSFPYRSLQYPELADRGAYSPKRVYAPDDIQLVVKEAKLRGIRVVPEIDLPSHSQAIAKSHPELMSHCPDPSEPLDPTRKSVYEFISNLYSEIAHLFPDDLIHIGGDEVSFDCWKNTRSIQQFMKRFGMHNETDLYAHFERILQSIVSETHNKTTIVWQEAFNLGLPLRNDTIIDVWKLSDNTTVAQATARNHSVLISSCWYLDYLNRDWKDFYSCVPRNFTGTTQQKSRVIGGHASMWGERVDATNFMSRVWPRASAAAERLWTGSLKSAQETVRERIIEFRCHMVANGIAAEPVAPGCCLREPDYIHEKRPRMATKNGIEITSNTS
jgi:hexosaminidase